MTLKEEKQKRKDELTSLFQGTDCILEAILILYEQQTSSEQEYGCTSNLNGVGFSGGTEASFATDIVKKYIQQGKCPSSKQTEALKKIALRHTEQLYKLNMFNRIKTHEEINKLFTKKEEPKKFTQQDVEKRIETLSRARALDFVAERYKNNECNDFLCSLYEQYQRKQCLSEKQWYYMKKNVAISLLSKYYKEFHEEEEEG